MGKHTTYTCDTCDLKSDKPFERYIDNYDICLKCVKSILRQVFAKGTLVLRPFCLNCDGTGKITEYIDRGYNENGIPVQRQCPECELK